MAINTATRLASAAVVAGIASLALATPADANSPITPGGGDVSAPPPVTQMVDVDDGWELAQIATGALGGALLVGAGFATAAGMRRHSGHLAHPA